MNSKAHRKAVAAYKERQEKELKPTVRVKAAIAPKQNAPATKVAQAATDTGTSRYTRKVVQERVRKSLDPCAPGMRSFGLRIY